MRNIALTLLLLLLTAPTVRAQREVYERYAQRDDLFVAYAQGYRLDSLTRIDAILIQAKDSAAWTDIRDEFELRAAPEEFWLGGEEGFVGKFVSVNDLLTPVALSDRKDGEMYCVIVSLLHERSIGVFFVQTDEQYEKVLKLYLDAYFHYVEKRYNKKLDD